MIINEQNKCTFARAVWFCTKWGFKDISNQFASVGDWIRLLLQQMDNVEMKEIVYIVWALWNGRNLAIFKNEKRLPNEIAKMGNEMSLQFRNAVVVQSPNWMPYLVEE